MRSVVVRKVVIRRMTVPRTTSFGAKRELSRCHAVRDVSDSSNCPRCQTFPVLQACW